MPAKAPRERLRLTTLMRELESAGTAQARETYARNLAVKIVDPGLLTPADLDRCVREGSRSRRCGGYAAMTQGDTECKTPDVAESIGKAWAHAKGKGFASPAAQECARDTPRLRC